MMLLVTFAWPHNIQYYSLYQIALDGAIGGIH